MVDNVNLFAVSNMTTSTERGFKSQYLFRTCSFAANMVTSLEFNPICCAAILCHCGQTGSSHLAILFIFRGSTTTSSVTGDDVAVPERFGQNEEAAGRNEDRTRKKPIIVRKVN